MLLSLTGLSVGAVDLGRNGKRCGFLWPDVKEQPIPLQELEASLAATQKQLQEALNELNTANTKISQLEEECSAAKAELKRYVTEMKTVVFQKEVDSSRTEELQNSVKQLKRDLSESVSALAATKSQLKDKQKLLDAVRHEMESLNREMEYLRESSASDMEEKTQHRERFKAFEVRVRQLEQDNTELARKVRGQMSELSCHNL